MPEASVERRSGARYAMVLAAEVVESPSGARLNARTADISRSGCYIDTLNPIPPGSRVRVRIAHHQEVFQAIGRVIYVSPGLGMGIAFGNVEPEEYARLERWFSETGTEF